MMTKAAMSIFSCYFPPGDDTGASFMVAQPSEPCWQEDGLQFALIAPALLVIAFYSLGYPMTLWALYHKNRHVIMRDQVLRAAGKGYTIKTNKDIHFRRRYGILYSYFKPTHYWWVLMFIGRKFFVCAFAVGLRNYPTFQLASMLLVMFCCLLIQVRQRPFLATRERAELLIDLNTKKLAYANSLVAHMTVFARAHHQDLNVESDRMRKLRKRIADFEAVIKSLKAQLLHHDTWWWNLNTLEESLSTGAVILMLAGITFDTTYVKNSPNIRGSIALVMILLLMSMGIYYALSFAHEYKNVKKVNSKLARVEWSKLKAWRIHSHQENKTRNQKRILPKGLEIKRRAEEAAAAKSHLSGMILVKAPSKHAVTRQKSLQKQSSTKLVASLPAQRSSASIIRAPSIKNNGEEGTVDNVDDLFDLFGEGSGNSSMGFDLDDLFDDASVLNGSAEAGLDFMNICMEPTNGAGFNIDSFLETGTKFEAGRDVKELERIKSKAPEKSRDAKRNTRMEERRMKRMRSRKKITNQKATGGQCLDELFAESNSSTADASEKSERNIDTWDNLFESDSSIANDSKKSEGNIDSLFESTSTSPNAAKAVNAAAPSTGDLDSLFESTSTSPNAAKAVKAAAPSTGDLDSLFASSTTTPKAQKKSGPRKGSAAHARNTRRDEREKRKKSKVQRSPSTKEHKTAIL